jgi:hypothetical protein
MVIHHGLLHWHYDVIISIHRRFRVGKIDNVRMWHTIRPTTEHPMWELLGAVKRERKQHYIRDLLNTGEDLTTPVLCKHFAEPIWYRIGPGWRIISEPSKEESHDHTSLERLDNSETLATLDL